LLRRFAGACRFALTGLAVAGETAQFYAPVT